MAVAAKSQPAAVRTGRHHGPRGRLVLVVAVLGTALAAGVIVATSIGPVSVPFEQTAAIIASKFGMALPVSFAEREMLVIDQVRLPRVLVGALVGAALGVAGVIMQGLFRNPLAEPGVVGVSSGAALGAVAAFFFGWVAINRWILPGAAFAGAVAAVIIVYAISSVGRRQSIATLLLVGIAMNAFLAAIISALVANARTEQELRSIVFWLQGGLEARTWDHAGLIVLPILLGILVTLAFARDLNVLLLGEDQARAAGVDVARTRLVLLGIGSLLTGVAVAVSGIIAFVGLVVPHMIRLALGPDHRILLPASALAGALFLVVCDLGARMVFNPITLQVGVITALVGAPLFLWLILRSRGHGIA